MAFRHYSRRGVLASFDGGTRIPGRVCPRSRHLDIASDAPAGHSHCFEGGDA
jgi:hypothetical protein